MVKDKALTEPKKVLEELNIRHAKILDAMESDCEKSRTDYLEGIHHKAMEHKSKVIARTRSEVQNRSLKKKNTLFLTLKESLLEEVNLATQSKEYESYFKEKFEKALEQFAIADDLIIGVHSNDKKYLPEDTRVETNDNLLGGFYIIKNDSEKYDFTLDSEVNALDDYLGCILNALFDSGREGCDNEE